MSLLRKTPRRARPESKHRTRGSEVTGHSPRCGWGAGARSSGFQAGEGGFWKSLPNSQQSSWVSWELWSRRGRGVGRAGPWASGCFRAKSWDPPVALGGQLQRLHVCVLTKSRGLRTLTLLSGCETQGGADSCVHSLLSLSILPWVFSAQTRGGAPAADARGSGGQWCPAQPGEVGETSPSWETCVSVPGVCQAEGTAEAGLLLCRGLREGELFPAGEEGWGLWGLRRRSHPRVRGFPGLQGAPGRLSVWEETARPEERHGTLFQRLARRRPGRCCRRSQTGLRGAVGEQRGRAGLGRHWSRPLVPSPLLRESPGLTGLGTQGKASPKRCGEFFRKNFQPRSFKN